MRYRHRGPRFGPNFGSKMAKAFVPMAGLALASVLSGCDADVSFNGMPGVPLSELDLDGATPTKLMLASPDTVEISDGKKLAIEVKGSKKAKERMRFSLEDGALGIMRESGEWNSDGKATVKVTMPRPKELTLAGSGIIRADKLGKEADITIAGSGMVQTPSVAVDRLHVTMAGSGAYKAAGKTKALDLTIAGSGGSDMAELKTTKADVSVVGSGSASFASDGEVDAKIAGSGTVTVIGGAQCTVQSFGSGKLVCERVKPKKPKKSK